MLLAWETRSRSCYLLIRMGFKFFFFFKVLIHQFIRIVIKLFQIAFFILLQINSIEKAALILVGSESQEQYRFWFLLSSGWSWLHSAALLVVAWIASVMKMAPTNIDISISLLESSLSPSGFGPTLGRNLTLARGESHSS